MMTDSPKDRIHHLNFGSRQISYILSVAPRKRLKITVRPDLNVSVISPPGFSLAEIEDAVQSKAAWIARQLDQLREFHPLPRPRQAVSGETILYLGRQYRLKITEGEENSAKLKGRYLWIKTRQTAVPSEIQQQIDDWYRTRAEDVFSRSFKKLTPVILRHGGSQAVLTIRKMKTRWGSCSTKNRITLNLHLIQAPSHCIDYVVMHELCHTKEHNHSKRFYNLLTLCMPDWKSRKAKLRQVVFNTASPSKP